MARSSEFDDDWDDRPRRPSRRKKKRRPSTAPLIAIGAGIGFLILMLAGGVGAIIHYSGGGSFSFGGLLPHPALAKPATGDMFSQVMNEDPYSSVERKLGPGCPLTMAEADAIMVPFQGGDLRWAGPSEVSLKAFGQRPPGNAQITQWYQWGSAPSRFFVGVGQNGQGEPIVLAKYYLVELPGGGYESLSERAPMTFNFPPPEVQRPRK